MKFNYKNNKIILDVKVCKNVFLKARGLMFKTKSKPLLFVYKKPVNQSIHSFFCRPFVAIWFNKREVVDFKFVDNWRIAIKPKNKFDELLEDTNNHLC